MKKIFGIIFAAMLLSGVGVLVISCSDTEGAENKTTEEKVRSVSVEVNELKGEQYTDYIPVLGVVKAVEKSALSAAEASQLKRVVKDKGSRVQKGDTVVIIDNDILKASLDAAEAQYRLDQITFEKQEQIYKDNVNSEYQFLQSKFRRDQSKANYELSKARYDKTYLIAPFDGIVNSRNYEPGEFVVPGTPVVEIVNDNKFKVEAGVPERFVGQIKKGDKAKIILKNVDSGDLEGVVTFVAASIIPDNRTFPVEVTLETKSKLVKPELAAEVFIQRNVYDNVYKLSDEVITRIDEGYVVFIAEGGIAKSIPVNILSRTGEFVAIKDGLKDGDKLITVGYQNLIDGQKVNIVN